MFTAPFLQIWIDFVQTIVLVVNSCALIYVMLLLRNEMRSAARALKSVLDGNAEVMKSLDWVWKRIHAIEVKLGMHSNDPPA
jgi:hypothetical protein